MPDNNNLKLNVTNFGPIVKAEIDLRPLTVFVGPSNTGKSYLAILIYALHRFFNGDAIFPELRDRSIVASAFYISSLLEGKDNKEMSNREIDLLVDWANQLRKQMGSDNYHINAPNIITKPLSSSLALSGLGHFFSSEIERCFNVPNAHSLRRYNSKSNSIATMSKQQVIEDAEGSNTYEPLTYSFKISYANTLLVSSIIENPAPRIEGEYRTGRYHDNLFKGLSLFDFDTNNAIAEDTEAFLLKFFGARRHVVDMLLPLLTHVVGSTIVNPLDRPAYYLPAGRTGMMHAHRLVVRSLISRASQAGLHLENLRPELSGVLADFLKQLINLGDLPTRSHAPYGKISESLETEMLRGAIRSEDTQTGYPVFSYQPEGRKDKIPLMNSSSMVSELAPVVLYLRHVVQPGDVLIIEEPEAHLHPGMQVEFIRQLAAAVRSGVRVMLTTHSEWVLEELANLVRLSDLPESQREGVGDWDVALSPEEVGVWLFEHKKRPRGSVVKEIQLDQDIGGFASGYDDVAIGTYNKWARIGNLISGARNGS